MMELSPGKIVGGIAAVGAACAIVLWGVPYYIHTVVREDVSAELKAAGVTDGGETANANTATLGAVLIRLDGMETRMIARDEFVMNYFKEQADRASAARETQ